MKKYLIAGSLAVMVFAMSAFAASLVVNAGTLQAGVDDNLACSDTADVTFDSHASGGDFWVTAVNVDVDEACVNEIIYLAITDVGGIAATITDSSITFPVRSGDTFFGNFGIPVADINDVNVSIYSSNPNNPGADSYAIDAFAS